MYWLLTLCVYTASNSDSVVPETEKLSMEGKIVQKLECRPYGEYLYICFIIYVRRLGIKLWQLFFPLTFKWWYHIVIFPSFFMIINLAKKIVALLPSCPIFMLFFSYDMHRMSSSSTIRLRPLGLFLPPENHLPISLVVFLYFTSLQVCN